MPKSFRRMTQSDIKIILADLARWSAGNLGSKLTWAVLVDRFGFTRQSLQAKSEIKSAYYHAKQSLAGELVITKEQATAKNTDLLLEIQRLQYELSEFKSKEENWKRRWQRIAFHIRQKGIQVQDVDRPTIGSEEGLSDREVAVILRPFDQEIPPSGRV